MSRHVLLAGLIALGAGCLAEPPEESPDTITVASLDEASYASLVHPVMEKTCGSADCHGKQPRGLRIYGKDALRLPGEAGETSRAEIRATYVSIMGLEPEKMNAFVSRQPRSADEAYKLLVLAKPLGTERHRPGVSLRKGERAEQCLFSWLMGRVDETSCKD